MSFFILLKKLFHFLVLENNPSHHRAVHKKAHMSTLFKFFFLLFSDIL